MAFHSREIFTIRQKYAIEYVEYILNTFLNGIGMTTAVLSMKAASAKQLYKDNRIVRIDEELTKIHNEVLRNSNCVHGALLRMNRSTQAEGTFAGLNGTEVISS